MFDFVTIAFLCVCAVISDESGRLAMTNILCNVFRTVIVTTPKDLLAVVTLSANRIAPAHEGVELGIGDASIIKVLTEAYGRKDDQIKAQMKVFYGSECNLAIEYSFSQMYRMLTLEIGISFCLDT